MSLSSLGRLAQANRPSPAPRQNRSLPARTAPSGDSVSLGSTATSPSPQAQPTVAPEKPKEIKGTVDLKPADLAKALKNREAREILAALDPEASLSSLSSTLFKHDPAAADDSVFQLKYYKGESWSTVTLTSTRQLSNGRTVSEVHLGANANRSAEQKPEPWVGVQYEPETFPTHQQLPEVLQKAWSKVFSDSPQEIAREAKELTGDIGELSKPRIYLNGLDRDTPFISFDWTGTKADGVKTTVRKEAKNLDLSVSLSPQQLKSGRPLPDAIKGVWSDWGLEPSEMAERMFQGACARPDQLRVGVSLGQSQDRITLGSSLKGDIEGK